LKARVYTFSLLTGNEEASITVTRPNQKNSAEGIKRSPPGYGTFPQKKPDNSAKRIRPGPNP